MILLTEIISINLFKISYKIEEMISMSSFNHVFKTSNKYKKIKDWITKGLVISTNHKHILSKQLFRRFDSNLKQKYNNYINILNTLIRNRKKYIIKIFDLNSKIILKKCGKR